MAALAPTASAPTGSVDEGGSAVALSSIFSAQRTAGGARIFSPQSLAPAVTAALGWTEGSEVFSASGTATAPAVSAVIGWTEGAEAFSATGIASAPDTVSGVIGWIEGAEVFAAAGTVSAPTAVTATAAWTEGAESFVAAGIVVNPITAAAAWTEGADVTAIAAHSVTQYARAPSGNGYRPQRDERQSRPAQVQRNNR